MANVTSIYSVVKAKNILYCRYIKAMLKQQSNVPKGNGLGVGNESNTYDMVLGKMHNDCNRESSIIEKHTVLFK